MGLSSRFGTSDACPTDGNESKSSRSDWSRNNLQSPNNESIRQNLSDLNFIYRTVKTVPRRSPNLRSSPHRQSGQRHLGP